MKFKFRNLLIGTGIALLGVAAVGAAVGITEKKSDKPDTSDTMTENLDLINLIGDLQSQINSVNTENEQIKSQLNSVNIENQKLNNKANQLSSSLTELQSENSTLKTELDSTKDELDSKHLYKHSLYMNFYPGNNTCFYLMFDFYSTQSESLSNDYDSSMACNDVNYFIDKLETLYIMVGSKNTYFINYYADDQCTDDNGNNFTALDFYLSSDGIGIESGYIGNDCYSYYTTFNDMLNYTFSLDSFEDTVVQIF